MKILFISPSPFLHSKNEKFRRFLDRIAIHGGDSPPLGLLHLASYLDINGYGVDLLDMRVLPMTKHAFIYYIRETRPDIAGIYNTLYSTPETIEIAKTIKTEFPHIKTIVGGPNLSIYPEIIMEHHCFDYGIMGEAEESLLAFMNSLSQKKDIRDIDGILFFEDGLKSGKKLFKSEKAAIIYDLDKYPFPARYLIKGKYRYFAAYKEPFTSMITSRGCPFTCKFCTIIPGSKRVRYRSPMNVFSEFEHLVREGYKEVNLFDDIFTVNKKRVINICDLIMENKLNIAWSIRARVDSVDAEMLDKMKQAGCRRLYFGVESGNDEILKKMGKRTSVKQVEKAYKLANKYKFETVSYFIIGYPGETEKTMMDSIKLASRIKTHFCSINMYEPVPSTPQYDIYLNEGNRDLWIDYMRLKTTDMPIDHGNLDRSTVEKYYKKAYFKSYFSISAFVRILSLINSFTRLKNFALVGFAMLMNIFFSQDLKQKS